MKKCNRTSFLLLFALIVLLTGCSSKDDPAGVSSVSSDGSIVDDAQSAMNGLESQADEAIDGVQSDMNSNEDAMQSDESVLAESVPSINETLSDDVASQTAALPGLDLVKPLSLDVDTLNTFPNDTITWGPGKDVDDANRPISCLSLQSEYGSLGALFVLPPTTQKTVYLTFDEGYENGYTPKILDVLKQKQCPATFFVTTPYVTDQPALISRMIGEGHALGNHTNRHPSMPSVSLARAEDEILSLHQQVSEGFGYDMTLFRPPMGEFSKRTLALTRDLGYQSVFWSFAYADWDPDQQPAPEQALSKMTGAAHDGAIYLLHAVSKTNAAVLGQFIDALRSQGYQFALLPAVTS